jgi:hypothetical protein
MIQIEQAIEYMKQKYGNRIVNTRVAKGDLVHKSSGLLYEVDSPEEVVALFLKDKGVFPYGAVHHHFQPGQAVILEMFNGRARSADTKKVLPYSEAVKARTGECLERALASQLVLQEMPAIQESVLMSGGVSYGDECLEDHAFNLAKRADSWFLIDTTNPVQIGDKAVMYVVPVLGMGKNREIIVEESNRHGRTYFF